MTVKYPNLRSELIDTLKGLSDVNYQQRVWINGNAPPGCVDEFTIVIEFFYGDTILARDIESAVGEILIDETEVAPVQNVIHAISHLLFMHGKKLTDQEYLDKHEWSTIVDAAQTAYDVLAGTEDGCNEHEQ